MVQMFRDELESAKSSHKKLRARIGALRRFIFLHYLLILLSFGQSLFTLYVVIVTDIPYKGTLLLFIFASLIVSWLALFPGSKGEKR